MNSWELIFQVSRVNGESYDEDRLPIQNWEWPRGTWFQRRLRHLRNGYGRSARIAANRAWHPGTRGISEEISYRNESENSVSV
jgi:hypothetical protein